jgi:predicted nucleic acid-binding protein
LIVLDASVLVPAIADDAAAGAVARARLRADPDLHVPHIADLEVLSVLRRLQRVGRIDAARSANALRDLEDLRLVRYPHWPLAARIWDLRGNLTPYDACYIVLAETLGCTLVTGDARISRVGGTRCEVEVV